MSLNRLRNQLRKLRERTDGEQAELYLRLLRKHAEDPRVTAELMKFGSMLQDAGRPLSTDDLMVFPGIDEMMNRLFRATWEAERDHAAKLNKREPAAGIEDDSPQAGPK